MGADKRSGRAFVHRADAAGDRRPATWWRAPSPPNRAHGAPVYLSLQTLDRIRHDRFPTISALPRRRVGPGARPRAGDPAAHYMMGGWRPTEGRTPCASIAAGEVAPPAFMAQPARQQLAARGAGVRRARRGSDAGADAPAIAGRSRGARHRRPGSGAAGLPTAGQVQDVMWQHVGLSRSKRAATGQDAPRGRSRGASLACDQHPFDPELHRLSSLVTVGLLVTHAALRREESRGGHFRSDFPRRDDLNWQKRVADVRHSGSVPSDPNAQFTMHNSQIGRG